MNPDPTPPLPPVLPGFAAQLPENDPSLVYIGKANEIKWPDGKCDHWFTSGLDDEPSWLFDRSYYDAAWGFMHIAAPLGSPIALANGIGVEPTFDGIKQSEVIPAVPSAGPPYDHDAIREYILTLKEGDRVVECGISGMTGTKGTVYLSKEGDICVRWDRPKGMGTSATGGTRRLSDVIQSTSSPSEPESPKRDEAEETASLTWVTDPGNPKRLLASSKRMPGMTLLLIEICEDREDRGCLNGAFIPDDVESSDAFSRAKIPWLKAQAAFMMREFLVAHDLNPTPPKPTLSANLEVEIIRGNINEYWAERFTQLESDLAAARAEISGLQEQFNIVRDDRNRAVSFANRIERGEVRFEGLAQKELKKILNLGLSKDINEGLGDAVVRVIQRLRAALESVRKVAENHVSGNHFYTPCGEICEIVDESLAALAPASPNFTPSPDGWRPIETAPKDGTNILATWMDTWADAPHIESVTWSEDHWFYTYDGDSPQKGNEPTHWMPIPPAPASSGKGEG